MRHLVQVTFIKQKCFYFEKNQQDKIAQNTTPPSVISITLAKNAFIKM